LECMAGFVGIRSLLFRVVMANIRAVPPLSS
jgi:hypothetical protein